MIKDNLFSIAKEHDSSIKHVTGKAKYTDDIPEPKICFMVLLVGVIFLKEKY